MRALCGVRAADKSGRRRTKLGFQRSAFVGRDPWIAQELVVAQLGIACGIYEKVIPRDSFDCLGPSVLELEHVYVKDRQPSGDRGKSIVGTGRRAPRAGSGTRCIN